MPVLLHHATDRLIQADRGTVVDLPEWFTVQPRPRHEKRILAELLAKGVVAFLPVVSTIKRWSDRRRVVELPLFFAVRLCANRTEFCRAGFGVMGQRSHQVCASSGHRSSAPGPENRTNTTGRRAGHIGFSSHILECGQARTHPGRRPGWSIGIPHCGERRSDTGAIGQSYPKITGDSDRGLGERAGLRGAFFLSASKVINRDPEIQLHHAASCGSGPPLLTGIH